MSIEKMAEAFDSAYMRLIPMATPTIDFFTECARIAAAEVHEAAFNERLRAVVLCEEIELELGLRAGAISNRVAKADPLGESIPIEKLENIQSMQEKRRAALRALIARAVTSERAACEKVCIDEAAAAGTEWRSDVCHGIADMIDRREPVERIADRLLAKESSDE